MAQKPFSKLVSIKKWFVGKSKTIFPAKPDVPSEPEPEHETSESTPQHEPNESVPGYEPTQPRRWSDITMVSAFYIVMGGFAYDVTDLSEDHRYIALTPDGFMKFAKAGCELYCA